MSKLTPVVAAARGQIGTAGTTPLGRGLSDIAAIYKGQCSCNRSKSLVFCKACGFYTKGRTRLSCSIHPRVTFLQDFAECPRCRSSTFLDEHAEYVQK